MNNPIRTLAGTLILAVSFMAANTGLAQDTKAALAVKLAQMQLETDGDALIEHLTFSAVEPLIYQWLQQVEENVAEDRQEAVSGQLDAELAKLTEKIQATLGKEIGRAAQSALSAIFMERLSESELKAIITYLESPASSKYQALSADAANAWAQRVVDATENSVGSDIEAFNAEARKITGAPASRN